MSATPYPYSPAPQYLPQPVAVQPIVVQVQQAPTSGLAVTSLVMGILGLVTGCCTFGIFSLLAVVFGHAGLIETRNNARSGRGMAVAGLVMGYVLIVPAVAFSIYVVVAGGFAAITTPPPTPAP